MKPGPLPDAPWRRHLRGAGVNVALVVASSALVASAFPPLELWPVAFIGLVPLLAALRRTSAMRAAMWLMLLWAVCFHGLTLPWLAAIFGSALPSVLVITAVPWLLFGAAWGFMRGRVSPGLLWASVPVLWLSTDWLRCEGWYFEFPWAQLGLSLVPAPGAAGLCAWVGVYGATLLVVMGNTLAITALSFRGRARWVTAACFAVLILLTLSVPAPRVQDGGRELEAVAIQGAAWDLDALAALSSGDGDEVDLIAWPETAVIGFPLSDTDLLSQLQAIARERAATLVVGTYEHAPGSASVDYLRRRALMSTWGELVYNSALVIAPDGRVLGTYRKAHPIQFFADGVPGRSSQPIPSPAGMLGLAICYDFDYAGTALRLVRSGAEVIVVPTLDSPDWPRLQRIQHARIAQARAAETGRWVIRPAAAGISQIIAPSGRVLAELPGADAGAVTGQYRLRSGLTPWARWGFALPAVCAGMSLAVLVAALFCHGDGKRERVEL